MRRVTVSIIVVNWNGRKWLKECLDSLRVQTFKDFEVIIVDNNSTDKSVETIKKLTDSKINGLAIRLIENSLNVGFATANNQAAKIAKGEYLFFLNNDTKIDANALSVLTKEIKENQKIGICGCKMMSYDGKRYFHTGIGLDIFGYPTAKSKIFYVEGAALIIRKQLFEKLNGFDPKYFMFHEDIDLSWRAQLLGYKVVALQKAIVYHYIGGSAGGSEMQNGKYKSSYLRRYYHERNNIRTLLKNYQIKTLLFILPLYFLINLMEVFFFLITLKFKAVRLYFKAYAWNFVNLRDTLRERAIIQSKRTVADKQLMDRMYFSSGKLIAFLKVGIPFFR